MILSTLAVAAAVAVVWLLLLRLLTRPGARTVFAARRVTVQIGVDTTRLQAALAAAGARLQTMADSFREIQRAAEATRPHMLALAGRLEDLNRPVQVWCPGCGAVRRERPPFPFCRHNAEATSPHPARRMEPLPPSHPLYEHE